VIEVPEHVRDGIVRYLKVAGLSFSAFDFVVRPDGEWRVYEANGPGMWGRLAEECGLPIAQGDAQSRFRRSSAL